MGSTPLCYTHQAEAYGTPKAAQRGIQPCRYRYDNPVRDVHSVLFFMFKACHGVPHALNDHHATTAVAQPQFTDIIGDHVESVLDGKCTVDKAH